MLHNNNVTQVIVKESGYTNETTGCLTVWLTWLIIIYISSFTNFTTVLLKPTHKYFTDKLE